VHYTLYVLLIAMVAVGLFLVWVRGDSFFGLFTVPALILATKRCATMLRNCTHDATIILILAGLHAAASLIIIICGMTMSCGVCCEQQLSWPKCFQPFDGTKQALGEAQRWFCMQSRRILRSTFSLRPCPRYRHRNGGRAHRSFCARAGLSGAVSSTSIIITAVLPRSLQADSRWVWRYLAARTDLEHYRSELQREKDRDQTGSGKRACGGPANPTREGLDPALAETVTAALTRDSERWINFMMRFELGLEEPEAAGNLKVL